jgi:hypothetical protein
MRSHGSEHHTPGVPGTRNAFAETAGCFKALVWDTCPVVALHYNGDDYERHDVNRRSRHGQ